MVKLTTRFHTCGQYRFINSNDTVLTLIEVNDSLIKKENETPCVTLHMSNVNHTHVCTVTY